jgi:hypothetical protein
MPRCRFGRRRSRELAPGRQTKGVDIHVSSDLENWSVSTIETQRLDNSDLYRSIVNFEDTIEINLSGFVRMGVKEIP